MTTKQQRILRGKLGECAQKYNSAPIVNLLDSLQEAFEEDESLSNLILNSHMIQLQAHQVDEFETFWSNVQEELSAA